MRASLKRIAPRSFVPSTVGQRCFHAIGQLPPSLSVEIVPMFTDNYAYIVRDEANLVQAIVDPAEPSAVERALERNSDCELVMLWGTHRHPDHVGGNEELAKRYRGIEVIGPVYEPTPAATKTVRDGEEFSLGQLRVQVLWVPCHTRGHIAFFVSGDDDSAPALFCGDTLFVAGCGRFFEGGASDMFHSLSKLSALPGNTRVYCGHEYTQKNLEFARAVDPGNAQLEEAWNDVCAARSRKECVFLIFWWTAGRHLAFTT